MIWLGCRTDSPEAHLYLYDDHVRLAEYVWTADRELAKGLLATIETFLGENNHSFATVNGLFVFRGPGSFTGLRIGITVMNVMSYSLHIPIIGTTGDQWVNDAIVSLASDGNDGIVLPMYGSEPRITQPRK